MSGAVSAAVNAEFAPLNTPVRAGDEVAFLPPVSGGAGYAFMTPQVLEKLKSVAARYEELTRLVSDPAVQADQPTYRTHSKALAELQETVDRFREFEEVERELTRHARGGRRQRPRPAGAGCRGTPRRSSSARDGLEDAAPRVAGARGIPTTIATSCSKSGPARAATKRPCSRRICSACTRGSPSVSGGRSRCSRATTPESAASRKSSPRIEGKGVYRRLKYESGVHRVQRVPGHRSQRPYPHLHRHRGRVARSRRGGHPDRGERPAHRYVLLRAARVARA